MTDQLKILQEATRIGEELINKAITDETGTYWLSLKMQEDRSFTTQVSHTIYNGSAGIALFLMELHKHTEQDAFLRLAEKAFVRLKEETTSGFTESPAFYTGSMGIAYAFLKFHQYTHDNQYLIHANTLAKYSLDRVDKLTVDDLINGKSGVLLGLLHLYNSAPSDWVLAGIKKITADLINSGNLSLNGMYWDKSPNQIDGLCGLSHGASGVGVVLLEAGRILGEPSLYDITRMAFNHENHYFNAGWNNWEDLRKGVNSKEEYNEGLAAYTSGNTDYFYRTENMNAWCHGAAGIGLARAHALTQLKLPYIQSDLTNAVNKVLDSDVLTYSSHPSFNLCHGIGGNLDLLVESASGQPQLEEQIRKTALRAIDQFQQTGMYLSGYGSSNHEEPGLFLGNAGVGYFMLRVCNPELTRSILLPVVSQVFSDHAPFQMSTIDIRSKIIKKAFRYSVEFAEQHYEMQWINFAANASPESLINDFLVFADSLVQRSIDQEKRLIEEIFRIEKISFHLDTRLQSGAEMFFDKVTAEQCWLKHRDDGPESLQLILSNSAIHPCEYYHQLIGNSAQFVPIQPKDGYILIRKTLNGVSISVISELAYYVLGLFLEKSSYSVAIDSFLNGLETDSIEEEESLRSVFRQQVIAALDSGLLKCC